ncbi:MAG: Fe-S cluster assembly protein IscX [Halobacteria archaeon]
MDWDEVDEIAGALDAKHAEVKDPFDVPFPKLMEMIRALEGFTGEVEPGRNYEKHLEAVQLKWAELRELV